MRPTVIESYRFVSGQVMNQPGVDNLNRSQEGGSSPRGGYVHAPGSRPLEGYTIRRGIGWGGFGEVYQAISDGGKEVALKLIRRNVDIELRGLRQCLNLKHPHLLDTYDIRQDADGMTWIVMELVNGSRLADRLDAYPNGMPLDMALRWFHGIALAVDYLHSQKIVHRDLKPGNIFCDDGVVKVGDYGLAKFMSTNRRAGHTESIGTVHYLAPEVAGGEYDYRMDIYALGIMLCELVTGRVPFDGESVGEILMKHMTAAPDLSRVPSPIREVVARALEKNPQKRFVTVAEMIAALPASDSTVERIPSLTDHTVSGVAPVRAAKVDVTTPGVGFAQIGSTADTQPLPELAEVAKSAEVSRSEALTQPWRHRPIRSFLRKLSDAPLWVHFLVAIAVGVTIYHKLPLWFPFALIVLGFYLYSKIASRVSNKRKKVADAIPVQTAESRRRAANPPYAQAVPNGTAGMRAARKSAVRRPLRPIDMERSLRDEIARTPIRSRMSELVGSLIVAVLVAIPTCAATALLRGHDAQFPPTQMVWVGVVGLLAAWSVLAVSKLWETDAGEQLPRRFILMVVGMGLGAFAWWLMTFFMIDLPSTIAWTPPDGEDLFFLADGQPKLAAFVGGFAILMLSVRWWKLADPARRVRFGFWGTVGALIWAWIITLITKFPWPWMLMVSCVMIVTIQLAAPAKFKAYRRRFEGSR